MPRMKKVLFPVTHKYVIKKPVSDLDNYHGEILECYNCFLPDHYYARVTLNSQVLYEGGVKYGQPRIYDPSLQYWKTQYFDINMTFAFTPLPEYMSWHQPKRLFEITYGPDELFAPWDEQEVVYIDDRFWAEVAPKWEANAVAAVTGRGGMHGMSIIGEDNWHPEYEGQPRYGRFLDYFGLFDWYTYPNEPKLFTNTKSKQIVQFSDSRTIVPAGNMKIRAVSSFYWYDFGPDMAAEYSSFECDFDGLPVYGKLERDFVFWIYDYSNFLGVNLQNIESKVEQGAVNGTFPRGFIPHEDARGGQNGKNWGYRWISNDWKYAPWERYPNL